MSPLPLLDAILIAQTKSLGADFREVWSHSEFSGVDRVVAAIRRDTNFETTMQFARGVVNICVSPCDNWSAFHYGLRHLCRIEILKRGHNFRKSVKSLPEDAGAKRFRWIRIPVGRS